MNTDNTKSSMFICPPPALDCGSRAAAFPTAQSRRYVVCPLPGRQMERATTDHIVNRRERYRGTNI